MSGAWGDRKDPSEGGMVVKREDRQEYSRVDQELLWVPAPANEPTDIDRSNSLLWADHFMTEQHSSMK